MIRHDLMIRKSYRSVLKVHTFQSGDADANSTLSISPPGLGHEPVRRDHPHSGLPAGTLDQHLQGQDVELRRETALCPQPQHRTGALDDLNASLGAPTVPSH